MWIIYTDSKGHDYPLEIGYKLINSSAICHDYERITGYCRDGCPDYGSGGCPPYAPSVEGVAQQYPFVIMIYAIFLSRFIPAELAPDDFSLQDVVLSDLLNQLGYAVLARYPEGVFFLTCGHCQGCGTETCSFKLGEEECRKPERRAYSIAATGGDVTQTLQDIFNITLQWIKGEQQTEYIIKVMGLLCADPQWPPGLEAELESLLNSLECVKYGVDSPEARAVLDKRWAETL